MREHAAEVVLVGEIVGVDAARRVAAHRPAQRGEHPPDRSAVARPARRSGRVAWSPDRSAVSSASVMSARSSWPVAGSTWVAISVSGFSATSTTASTSSVSQRGLEAGGLRERGQRVAAGDEQRPDVAGLDLVDERDRRDLPEDARKLGPARRGRRPGARRARLAPPEPVDDAAVEVHAAGAIERARRDEDDPAQPLREHAVASHRHAGAAVHRDPSPVRAHVGDELVEQRGIDVGGRRRPLDREPGERGAQRRDLGRRRSARAARARRRRARAARSPPPPSTATSAPGRTGTYTSASAAVSVRRGSSTHTRPPRARYSRR